MSKYNIKLIERNGRHYYETPIGILPSSTSIISILDKPALSFWRVRETVRYLGEQLESIKSGELVLDAKNTYRILQEAKLESSRISEDAASIGTTVHRLIEQYVKFNSMPRKQVLKEVGDSDERIRNAFSAFLDWMEKNNFDITHSEVRVWSSAAGGYAGTADFIGFLDSVPVIGDIKTSKGFYLPDYALQLASYRNAYEEQSGEKLKKMFVLRLDKITGMPSIKFYKNYNDWLQMFKYLCRYWHLQNKVMKKYD